MPGNEFIGDVVCSGLTLSFEQDQPKSVKTLKIEMPSRDMAFSGGKSSNSGIGFIRNTVPAV